MKRQPDAVRGEMYSVLLHGTMNGKYKWVPTAQVDSYLTQVGPYLFTLSRVDSGFAYELSDQAGEVILGGMGPVGSQVHQMWSIANNEASGESDRLEEALLRLKAATVKSD